MNLYIFCLFVSIFSIACFASLDVIPAEIIKTVKEEDMGHLEWLLGEGVNPDYYDPDGDRWTPLIYAVSKGKTDFVARLLRARANPNQAEKDGWTPLHFSAAYGYGTITRLLLEAGADASAKTLLGKSVLDVANEYRKWEVLEVLETASKSKMSPKEAASAFLQNVETESSGDLSRSAGTSPDEISDFFKAAALGPDLTLKKFIKQGRVNINAKSKGDGRTALHRAANSGSLSRVRLLLDNDAYLNDVDVNGWTALMFAAAHAHYDVCQLLLTVGADQFARNSHGITAYVLAAENGHPEISAMITTSGLKSALFAADEKRMMAMLRAGADPDTIGPVGFSAVMHFASRGNVDNVQEIVRLGANVNIQETDKWTALMFACARGDIQNVVILMNNGADATLRNKDGASAMDIATKGKHDAIVEILKSYQVKGKGNLRRNH